MRAAAGSVLTTSVIMSRQPVNLTTLFLGRLDLNSKPVLGADPFANNCTYLLEPGFSVDDFRLMTIGHLKKGFFTICDEILNFVDFINGDACLNWRIINVMLVF